MIKIQHIQVAQKGAELTSLIANDHEYIWRGDPLFWGHHAPILFPIVGRLANDTLRINGKTYQMKQHGFARDTEFVATRQNASFRLPSGLCNVPPEEPVFMLMKHKLHENYPYNFTLRVRYAICGNTLEVNWEVLNCDEKNMYFQIGAHPGFLLPDFNPEHTIHGYFRCYNEEGQTLEPISTTHLVDGLRVFHTPKELINKEGLIPITNNTFANDAILMESGNVASVGLLDIKGNEILRMSCPQAQVFGLWAPNKPCCPFVCIEPWCGVADRQGFNSDITKRDNIQQLAPGQNYSFNYTITILGE